MATKKYNEYKQLNLPAIGEEVLQAWEENGIFEKSIANRSGHPPFVFYEGPPSANGMPGIHHVMARTIKDLFCRYKTLKGFRVERKGGWDTHGLPVELQVEKTLGITKEDIGKTISIEQYNHSCRTEVMKYKDAWDDITRKIGFWVDLEKPYITFDNKYIETCWHLLKQFHQQDLLYKGYTIQPYSPAAGTGLSTHELNMPGCYRNVKDATVVAQFRVVRNEQSEQLLALTRNELYFLAWTTTPWTLPSNTALAVGAKIRYLLVKTINPYTYKHITVILAEDRYSYYFPEKNQAASFDTYQEGDKLIPNEILGTFAGAELAGIRYEQLLPYAQPEDGDAFRVATADFVTTEDGTGIVHIAPSFGADDFRVAKLNGIGSLTLVDKQGRFTEAMGEFAGKYVKNEYDPLHQPDHPKESVDVELIVKLKQENKAFKTEKYEHSYPHCWRTDKPILYYPLDSWFIKTTACKDKMMALNNTINWKPRATGTGRFGNWLENLVDWNLSRSRYWGVPLPVWVTDDKEERICIGSVEELITEIEKAVAAGFMQSNPYASFKLGDLSQGNYDSIDLHRPFVDDIMLVSKGGRPMHREPDLIDVWFDSGAMPYAQLHYPFENKEVFEQNYPADFIAEGVDQTRGWFFTLHAIAAMLFDSVAFKNVVSNGLVLDKDGNKMSKRLGNAIDPFEVINQYGPDATRWYMITNAQPWDNLKFDLEGVGEVQRKFFGTLHNTYAFFSLYANIDGFRYAEAEVPVHQRPEIDRWILSELNTLVKEVDDSYADYEPTRAGRAIADFVDKHLSNWYVRLCRRRFWKGEYSEDKISAYQTLYRCMEVILQLSAPIAPFFADKYFTDLNRVTNRLNVASIHLSDFPVHDPALVDKELEAKMELAQKISSMTLSLRKKQNIRVRQPLNKIMIPTSDNALINRIASVKDIVRSEVNIKDIEVVSDQNEMFLKTVKANFKKLGPRFGKQMKEVAAAIGALGQEDIQRLETEGALLLNLDGQPEILADDVEIITHDIPGWVIINQGNLTVALDITITEALKEEGITRELINRIQHIRKDKNYEVVDRVTLEIEKREQIISAINNNFSYICAETLAASLNLVDKIHSDSKITVDLIDDISIILTVEKA